MTNQELIELAHKKNYFGDLYEVLYAFNDGNMFGEKSYADKVKDETGKDYIVVKKGNTKIEEPKKEVEKPLEKEVKKSKKDK